MQHRRRSIWVVGAVVSVFAMVAASCGGDGGSGAGTTTSGAGQTTTTAGKPVRGGSITIGLEAENNTGWFMPDAQCPVACAYVTNAVFDPLMKVDADGAPAPWLALSATP